MKRLKLVVYCLLFISLDSFAVRIKIDSANVRGMPIAVVPFGVEGASQLPHQLDKVINFDLEASGQFEAINSQKFVTFPSKNDDVRFKDWRLINAEALVIGNVQIMGEDQFAVTYRIYDVARQKEVGNGRFPSVPSSYLRNIAHQISDDVYRSMLNRSGAFNSRIAFVRKQALGGTKALYRLMVADWDGYGEKEVYSSRKPLLSPDWSPDGSKLAFVSYSKKGPVINVLDLALGHSQVIANFKGVNSAPAWSPNGTKLAYSTSKHGSPDIYVYDVNSQTHTRITTHYGIDTEPAWSANGRSLLFTSNRTRRPQIYEYNLGTKNVTRITFEGKENANASYDSTGNNITLVSDGGKIAVQDRRSGSLNLLTNAKFDESPSFSPNGDMVLYVSEQNYEPAFVVASADGRVRSKLRLLSGEIREPSWSPLKK